MPDEMINSAVGHLADHAGHATHAAVSDSAARTPDSGGDYDLPQDARRAAQENPSTGHTARNVALSGGGAGLAALLATKKSANTWRAALETHAVAERDHFQGLANLVKEQAVKSGRMGDTARWSINQYVNQHHGGDEQVLGAAHELFDKLKTTRALRPLTSDNKAFGQFFSDVRREIAETPKGAWLGRRQGPIVLSAVLAGTGVALGIAKAASQAPSQAERVEDRRATVHGQEPGIG